MDQASRDIREDFNSRERWNLALVFGFVQVKSSSASKFSLFLSPSMRRGSFPITYAGT